MPRIVLLEGVHGEAHRHHRVEFFPYIAGLALVCGWEVDWWVIHVPLDRMHQGERYVFDLPAAEREVLARALADRAPEVVVCHDAPSPVVAGAVADAAGGARLVDLSRTGWVPLHLTYGDVLDLLLPDGGEGAGDAPVDRDTPLLELERPVFARRSLTPAPPVEGPGGDPEREPQPLRLVGGASTCAYRRPVRANPAYAEVADPRVAAHLGCTFCTVHTDREQTARSRRRLSVSAAELALRQIAAHQADARGPDEAFAYLFEDYTLSNALDAFLEPLLARDLGPSTLYTLTRADVLLAQRDALERLLPRMAAAGHRLRLLSVGAENFSPPENERFNKGVSVETLWDCVALFEDLEARFPDTFASADREGYFSAILFTPWTRPADLRANVEAARRLGAGWLRRSIGTRLQLRPPAPVTALAERDGLVTEAFGSLGDIVAVCLSSPLERERPWRFADPRTETIHRLVIRLEPLPVQAAFAPDDPLVERLRRWSAPLGGEPKEHYVDRVAAIVAAVEALGAAAPLEDILAAATDALPAPRPRPDGAVRRVGPNPAAADHPAVRLVRAVEEQRPGKLQGYRLTGYDVTTDGAADGDLVTLAFSRGAAAFRVTVRPGGPGAQAWLVGERYAIVHAADTPPEGEGERRLGRLLVALFDRYMPRDSTPSQGR